MEDCGQCSGWVGVEHREGQPVLRATVVMTLSTVCQGPELNGEPEVQGAPGDTPGEPSEGAFWTVIKTQNG